MSKVIKITNDELEVIVTPLEYLNRISAHLGVMLHAGSMSADPTVISIENIRFLKSILDDYLKASEKKFSDR